MSKSYSKIRHIQKSNLLIENRLLMEEEFKAPQGSTWACYSAAEGPPPDYGLIPGNQIEFEDDSEKKIGKLYLPGDQKIRGEYCETPLKVLEYYGPIPSYAKYTDYSLLPTNLRPQ